MEKSSRWAAEFRKKMKRLGKNEKKQGYCQQHLPLLFFL